MKLAYLLSYYPAPSHTFFLAEVEGLRARGAEIHTASINPAHSTGTPSETAAVASTMYVKRGSSAALALQAFLLALRHPMAFLRGLALVLGLEGASLRERGLWTLYLGEAMIAGAWMRRNDLTHLHVHFGGPVASVALLTSKAWRVPYSITVHGPEELLNVDRFRLREKFRAAKFIVCISEFCRSQVAAQMDYRSAGKCIVNRLGVSESALAPYRQQPRDAPPRPLQVVCTGRLVQEKGQHVLLEACARLLRQGVELQLTLIGGGPQRARLEEFARSRNIADRVRFLGVQSHEETLRVVSQADLFVLPSSAEGVPVAIMEAMALNVPVISTYIAGIPELVENGVSGWLVPAGSVDALEAAMTLAAGNPSLRATMAAAARKTIDAKYSLDTNHATLLEIFHARAGGVRA